MKSDGTVKRLLHSLALPAFKPSGCRVLTEKDRARIMLAFSNTTRGRPRRKVASPESIDHFIAHLDLLCESKKSLLDQPKKIDVTEKREDVLKACRRTLELLRKIERGKLVLWHDATMDHVGVESAGEDRGGDFLCEILQAAWDAVGPLQKFTATLEVYHDQGATKAVGRRPADSDHFIRRLAEIYKEHIGRKPSTYRDGPFFCVVQAVLNILGQPSEYPERAIKNALK